MGNIESFLTMSSEPYDYGLCDYCDAIPCSLSPNGPIMCEGAWCRDAYDNYTDDMMSKMGIGELCEVCKHRGCEEDEDGVPYCNDCDGYDGYEPVEELEVEVTIGPDAK